MTTSKSELVNALREKRKQISEVRSQLEQAKREKEQWFAKTKEYSAQLKTRMTSAKDFRTKRDALTKEVQEHKKIRESARQELNKRMPEFEKTKTSVVRGKKVRKPSHIQHEIDTIELRIETEAPSFAEEQRLMKRLKDLRKERAKLHEQEQLEAKKRQTGKEVSDLSSQVRSEHSVVRGKATESQQFHEKLITIRDEVGELRKQEKKAFATFLEHREKFTSLHESLKKHLAQAKEHSDKLDAIKKQESEARQQEVQKEIKSKQELVQEKIKKGQKLTTEDLVYFQDVKKK